MSPWEGNKNSISDTGVACLCVYTAIYGAFLNVKINLKELSNDKGILKKAKEILEKSSSEKEKIINYIESVIWKIYIFSNNPFLEFFTTSFHLKYCPCIVI